MLSTLQNNTLSPMNRPFGATRPGGFGGPQGLTPPQQPGAGGDQGQVLKALAALLLSQLQGVAGGGGGPAGGGGGCADGNCPVNFGSSFGGGNNASASASSSSPGITINGQPVGNNGSTNGGTTTTNNGPSNSSNTGSPTVNINAKKIKNSNIIVNGENVTATAGKKNNKPA